ncbi:efflux RND transporter permease subunit [Candidatus Peregrinibacteria bacterium]|nr:efflux RND transporter permease subunit [Candidatus Peregrinibacteria bacterium]
MSGLDANSEAQVSKELEPISNSAWGYFIRNRRMAIMLGLIFMVTGIYSYFHIPRESTPEVKIPYGMVVTSYPGASPQEVSEQVTFKIEQKIKSLEDLKQMTSSSSEGVSQIFVEFEASADLDDSIRKLKDRVDDAKTSLPKDANDPFVQELSFSDTPIVTYSFFGDVPYEQLLAVVENVQNEMEKIRGVQSASIAGKRARHVLVAVREEDMLKYGLGLRTISQAIASYHLNGPVGNIEIDDLYYRVRISAEQESVEKVASIPIFSRNGALIYIRDVANVSEELEEQTTASRVSINGQSSFPAISISVVKKTGENILETAAALKATVEGLQRDGTIPPEVEYLTINDMSEQVQSDFSRLMKNALATVMLIFLVLLLALGCKEAIIGGISIPFTFLVAFTFLYKTGNTFNFLVLFSLILGLGLLVDTTIVMMEGMHEFLYRHHMTPVNAALKTVKTYRFSLMSGMLTTIAAFVPMYLMSGIMGEFFKFIPTTVNAVLISAFIIGLFMIPAYAVIFMHKIRPREKENRFFKALRVQRDALIERVNQRYARFLDFLLSKKRRRRAFWEVTVLAFLSAIALPILGLVKIEGFPFVDIDFMMINVEAPVGVTLDRLEPIVHQIEEVVQADPNIESYVVNLGTGGNQSLEGALGGGSSSTHLAGMTLNFVDKEKRTDKSFIIAENYKNKLSFITDAKITVPELRSGPPVGSAIQVRIFGEDYSVLQTISADVQKKLKELGGDQVDDDIATSTAEFTFDFSSPYSKAVLKSHNLSVAEVAQEVRMAVYPTKAATIKRGEDEIDIDVQRDWGGYKPTSIDAVKQIPIQSAGGDYTTLGLLAIPEVGVNLTSITHYDGDQAVTVSSDVAADKVPADILNQLIPYLDSYDWPEGYSYRLTGGNEDTMQSFRDLLNAMAISILLIFLILVTQFNSFRQPFVILMALPLSLIGVFYGFMIIGLHLGVATMIGIAALAGIVVNDAIVLVDRINENRRTSGMALKEAILEAGPARLQPIVITSVTTILGVLPISLTDAFWTTLGMAIVFGMAFSTVLTLLIIPVFYYSTELRGERKKIHVNLKDSSK